MLPLTKAGSFTFFFVFRDDLLLDLHKFSRLSPSDQDLLNDYFAPVSGLSHKMEKHIQVVMTNTLNAVRQNPKVSSFLK